MTSSAKSIRKAAILLASLDAEHAADLLAQMPAAQAAALQEEVAGLGQVDANEQQDVIEEFFRIGPLLPAEDPAGIELDTLAPSVREAPAQDAEESELVFRLLEEASPEKLAPFLVRERPQTIAVVMSHLPADRAADVFTQLPGELQAEVARRLADLGQTDPEILREVERGLETWLSGEAHEARQSAGLAALSGILDAASPRARHEILANLARHDRELAAKLESRAACALSFSDVTHFDPTSLAVLLRHADREVLVLALAGAAPRFAERASALLPPEQAPLLGESLSNLGPTRLADVEEAQQQLAELARQLELRGEIAPEVRGRLSVAV